MDAKKMMKSVPDALIWTALFVVLFGVLKSIGIAVFVLVFLLVQYYKRWRPQSIVKKTISEQFEQQLLKLQESEKNKFLNILNANQRYQYEQFLIVKTIDEKERLFMVLQQMKLIDKFYKWESMVGIEVRDIRVK